MSKKHSHTRGPWKRDKYGTIIANGDTLLVYGVGTPCNGHLKMDEAEANTNLLCAAPELLEIVKMLEEYVRAGEPLIYFAKLSPHSDEKTLGDMVLEAIKKVEGKLP